MKDLHLYFRNPFNRPSFGIDKLLAFTTAHLGDLRENNKGGVYDGRIAATESALKMFRAAFVSDATKLGGRKTAKGNKRKFRKSLPPAIGEIYVVLAAKYGLKAPVLKEFFPMGRTAFYKFADDQLGNGLGSLVAALTKHQAELGADVVSQAKALQSDWQTIYEASESSSGAKSATEAGRRNARTALQKELFLNLLALVQNYPDQPEQLDRFMRQSLLKSHRSKKAA